MRGHLGYPSDTHPLNNRSFAFNSTGRRGVLCEASEAKILPSRSYESPVFTVESTIKPSAIIKFNYNKQLLDEVEHDIMNYQNLVSVLSASADNTDLGFNNT